MNQQPLWRELLNRLGAVGDGSRVIISRDELRNWPASEVRLLQQAHLLVRTKPATAAICPGCEEQCAMPVHTQPTPQGKLKSFIFCDKRDDTTRIPIPTEYLEQGKCSIPQVLTFVASTLALQSDSFKKLDTGLWQIGMAFGNMRSQMLCLKGEGLQLVAGSKSIPLAELIVVGNSEISLDMDKLKKVIDTSNTGDPRYTPRTVKREAEKLKTQEMYASWQKECNKLKKKHPDMSKTWYAQKIAKMPIAQKRDWDTIRGKITI